MSLKKIIKGVAILLIIIFLYSYFIEKTGYYEYNLGNKKTLTDEQIKQFELDVKSGKSIDLDSYLKETSVDYSNKLTRRTSNISLKLNDYLKNILTGTFDVLEKFVR